MRRTRQLLIKAKIRASDLSFD
ncbi:hypothetical protein S1OALGB6SA_285, partial [Olavius algarvensis spirochete endosymbiont]